MPYSRIMWVKLYLDLFDDDKFLYQLNETQQLLFIKMLALAGKTFNNIPKNDRYICATINYPHQQALRGDLQRLIDVFPSFKETNTSYYFEEFEKCHNQLRILKGYPRDIQRDGRRDNTSPLLSSLNIYIEIWNKYMSNKIEVLTVKRKEKLKARLKEKVFVDRYEDILQKIKSSPFLCGRKPSKSHPNWKADFDWVIANEENYNKVLEGKYDNPTEAFKERLGL